MPVMPEDIQPVAAAPAAADEVTPAEEPEAKAPVMPPELAKIPALAALANGSPPATYGPLKSEDPQLKVIGKKENAEALKKMGFAAFESESQPGNFVLFNGLLVKPQEVMDADKAGQLDSIAVPFQQLAASFESARLDGGSSEVPADGAPAAPAPAGEAAAAPMPSAPPAPAGAQKRLLAARVTNLQPGSPTSGPAPGRGRVLNAISKPVV